MSTGKTGTACDEWACLQTERLGGWKGKAAYRHTHTFCGRTRGLDMLHIMLTCHYIPPTVFQYDWLQEEKAITISCDNIGI